MIKVGFPNKLFIIFDHATTNEGFFSFEFWYMDQRSDGVDAIEIGPDGYVLESILIEVEAKNIWVYILGGAGGLLLIIIFVFICCRVQRQHKITEEVEEERA